MDSLDELRLVDHVRLDLGADDHFLLDPTDEFDVSPRILMRRAPRNPASPLQPFTLISKFMT